MDDSNNPLQHMLLEAGDERISSRRRETFLMSAIVHLLAILVVITNPDLFKRKVIIPAEVTPERVSMLYEPPPERKKIVAPPVRESPQERPRQQPQRQQAMPQLGARPFVPPPQGDLESKELMLSRERGEAEKEIISQAPEIGLPDFPDPADQPGRSRPSRDQERTSQTKPETEQSQLNFPAIASSRGTEAILRGLARDSASGEATGFGTEFPEFDSSHPDLSIPGPQIISDTMGVDFQPYLLRVYLLVRRNWYSVIPELARLGKQGRVALEFTILRDGSVPELNLVVGSGTPSFDSATMASIRLSNPFPGLPSEFPGESIQLRFVYLYNIRPAYR